MVTIHEFARYNAWANSLLTGYYRGIPADILQRPVVSSFPSIRKTFLHLLNAEHLWLERMQGQSPSEFLSATFQGTDLALLDRFSGQSKKLRDYICALPQHALNEPVTYETTQGVRFTHARALIAMHCLNHSSYHRGQLTVLARQSGLQTLPSTDLIYYLRQNGNSAVK